MSYFTWYFPGDGYQAGITAVFTDEALHTFGNIADAMRAGEAEDVFDVALYGVGDGTDESYMASPEYAESRQAMENLLQLANIGLKVLLELPKELDSALDYHAEYDRPYTEVEGGWLDSDGAWASWEAEAEGAHCEGRIEALSGLAKKILVIE